MTEVHGYIAYAVPAGWALLALWTLLSFLRNKPPGGGFWNLLAVLQAILGVQVVIGAILFLTGARPASNGPSWLHYVYGALFPVALLVAAHRYARKQEGVSWIVFGIASVVIFGLTFRALQTGLGID
ncbi:hypothetical protein BH24ACT26_BH24ACT26_12000 [soil metagenome]